MNKHTPQEWADITGCYVVRDRRDENFTLFKNKPEINHEKEWWYQKGDWGALPIGAVPLEFRDLDWTTLYEPQKKDPIEVFKDIQSRRNIDSEPNPHASEVYVGPEYKMLCGDEAGDGGYIGDMVNGYLAKGWQLYGAPFYGNGYIWQAMVRGV